MNRNSQQIDALFWKIALNDDEAAFHELFVQFFAPLCVFAMRYIPNKEVCKDLVQELFFKLWKNRKNIQLHSSMRNLLVSGVKNACIDYLRKQELEQSYLQKMEEHYLENREKDENLYSVVELQEMLSAALARLPEHIRHVFEQNRFEGKTYADIAEEHHLSIKTIESYMTKALKHLRTELKDYYSFVLLFL
ncbi:MAG: RNA polymerase sigma-70 factor [Candidatus Symbiothrix sp.]|jgi:RNA polymerase sigma-70 factor (ECF subfamily)|nr:RNA polymerase sigma-70 factor [Candidatus Symbiothrix sp.]